MLHYCCLDWEMRKVSLTRLFSLTGMWKINKKNMKFIVFLLCLVVIKSGHSFQPEFIRSFITRPWMLTNNSMNDPATEQNQDTLSIYTDNWSPHQLKLVGDEIRSAAAVHLFLRFYLLCPQLSLMCTYVSFQVRHLWSWPTASWLAPLFEAFDTKVLEF